MFRGIPCWRRGGSPVVLAESIEHSNQLESHMVRKLLLALFVSLFMWGCAAQKPATARAYSHWYERSGGGSMTDFKKMQQRCLEQVGAASDPASIEPDSPEHNAYIECLNGAQWCSQEYNCNGPDA